MASLRPYPQFETNLMSNRKVTELLLQLNCTKAHGKNYIKVKPHLVRHLLRNRLLLHEITSFRQTKSLGYSMFRGKSAGEICKNSLKIQRFLTFSPQVNPTFCPV